MKHERIHLFEDREDVWLDVYAAEPSRTYTRKAILVIPGGAYEFVTLDHEGEPIAHAFLARGYNAFVLNYSVNRKRTYPEQLIEASAAIKYIRDHASELGHDPEKVFAIGFSAGGHLCASLGTLWHRKEVYEALDMPFGYNKPTGVMLIYPVISAEEGSRHGPSFRNLLGDDHPTKEALDYVSLEKHVDENSVPAFLMHTAADSLVRVSNSLKMAQAYAAAHIPFELHVYPEGRHGVSLATEVTCDGNEDWILPHVAGWIDLAIEWAELQ